MQNSSTPNSATPNSTSSSISNSSTASSIGTPFDVHDPAAWQSVDAAIFDLDGTLYDPKPIRWRMLIALGVHSLKGPTAWSDLKIISTFRRLRETLADDESTGIEQEQYEVTARALDCSTDQVRTTIAEWIHVRPLPHLMAGRFQHVDRLFSRLADVGKTIAVYSDYPVTKKLAALDLRADLEVSADDPPVNRLKPHPRGLEHTLERLGVTRDRAVMIGDRDDRDGEAARRAGVRYAIKTRAPSSAAHEFSSYSELVQVLG